MSANPNALSPTANPNTQTIRVAAIDIGTVTCRLMIADVTPQGVDVVERHTEIVNLGEGVDATGILAPQAMDRAIQTLTRYRSIMDRCGACHPIDTTVCMATSASRDAKNAPEFLDRLAQLGISPDVIPGSKEAELSFRGASNSLRDQQLLFADIGGGLRCGRAGIPVRLGFVVQPRAQHGLLLAVQRVQVGLQLLNARFGFRAVLAVRAAGHKAVFAQARLQRFDVLARRAALHDGLGRGFGRRLGRGFRGGGLRGRPCD